MKRKPSNLGEGYRLKMPQNRRGGGRTGGKPSASNFVRAETNEGRRQMPTGIKKYEPIETEQKSFSPNDLFLPVFGR